MRAFGSPSRASRGYSCRSHRATRTALPSILPTRRTLRRESATATASRAPNRWERGSPTTAVRRGITWSIRRCFRAIHARYRAWRLVGKARCLSRRPADLSHPRAARSPSRCLRLAADRGTTAATVPYGRWSPARGKFGCVRLIHCWCRSMTAGTGPLCRSPNSVKRRMTVGSTVLILLPSLPQA